MAVMPFSLPLWLPLQGPPSGMGSQEVMEAFLPLSVTAVSTTSDPIPLDWPSRGQPRKDGIDGGGGGSSGSVTNRHFCQAQSPLLCMGSGTFSVVKSGKHTKEYYIIS